MSQQASSVQVVPNLTGEVFDVSGTSRSENYVFSATAGLTSPAATNWTTKPQADVANASIATTKNIKTFTTVYTGIPDTVAKMARNISTVKGPTTIGQQPTYGTRWTILNKSNQTILRNETTGVEYNASTVDPVRASEWNSWNARMKGQFDYGGFPVGCFESSISQFKVFKFSSGGLYTFTGYSPIMIHSGEVYANNLGTQTNNVVFYTKDTTSATDRSQRRGSTLFARVEEDNYGVEYEVCDFGAPIKCIEHAWITGGIVFLICLMADGTYRTLASAPYPPVVSEGASAAAAAQSILYSQVATSYSGWPLESTEASAVPFSIVYQSVVINNDMGTEGASANAAAQSILYAAVVVNNSDWATESSAADVSPVSINYIYAPVAPSTPPEVVLGSDGPEAIESSFTAQGLSYA